MKHESSQEGSTGETQEVKSSATTFDFSRLDRIPKNQIRALHLMHENFAKNLASSLSAYLRENVSMNLASVDQITYGEFLEGLASPTFIASIGLLPYDGTAVLELSPGLVFTFIEMLLGGDGKTGLNLQRKVTEIEKSLMRNLLRIILQDLSEAWKSVVDLNFDVQSLEDEPQSCNFLSPNEGVVTIRIEVGVASATGMLNLAIPSIFVKRLRHMLDQPHRPRRTEAKPKDQAQMAELLTRVGVTLEARLDGGTISTQTLFNLDVGDVLMLDYPLDREITARLNGVPKFEGNVEMAREKFALRISAEHELDEA